MTTVSPSHLEIKEEELPMSAVVGLAGYQRVVERINAGWPVFRAKRAERLEQQKEKKGS